MGFLYDHTATIVRRLYDSRIVGPPVLLLDVRRRVMPLDMAALSRVLIAIVRMGIRIRGIRS